MEKIYKPGECMKYMHIELHPALAQMWFCEDISREVTAAGAHLDVATDIFDPALVLWSRSIPARLANTGGEVHLTPTQQRCNRALYVLTADTVAEHVIQRTLAKIMAEVKALLDCRITLVVFGVKDYLKRNNNSIPLNEIELEMSITDLLVSEKCDTVIVNTPNELALLVVQFTKAIAEAPRKKAKRDCDEQAEFYMRGNNKQCVAIDKDGNGMCRLWQQMMAVLPHSSLEMSRSLCAQYKTPLALYETLQSPNGVGDVADVEVSRAGVPGARARRVGPEFANKLKILFTAEDGNTLVE